MRNVIREIENRMNALTNREVWVDVEKVVEECYLVTVGVEAIGGGWFTESTVYNAKVNTIEEIMAEVEKVLSYE